MISARPLSDRSSATLRIEYEKGTSLVFALDGLIRRERVFIIGHHRGKTRPVRYDRVPVIKPLPFTRGGERLLSKTLNARALSRNPSPSTLMTGLADAFQAARFYEMIPGRLRESVELIHTIFDTKAYQDGIAPG